MKCQSREIDGEQHLVFSMRLSAGNPADTFNLAGMEVSKARQISILFECAYKQEVKIQTDQEVTVNQMVNHGETVAFGDLARGFGLSLFSDSLFSEPMGSAASLFIGSLVFVQVSWNVDVSAIAGFFVDKCFVEVENVPPIELISDNCYSEAFGVRQLQSKKGPGSNESSLIFGVPGIPNCILNFIPTSLNTD